MSGKLAVSAIFLSFFSCAEPKYVNATSSPSDSPGTLQGEKQNEEQNSVLCETHFKISELCLQWAWEKRPTTKEAGSLIFKTYHLNAFDHSMVEVDPEKPPQLILWMPGMNHGSTPTQVQRLDVGTFRADKVFFVMPGAWEFRFQFKEGNQILDEARANTSF